MCLFFVQKTCVTCSCCFFCVFLWNGVKEKGGGRTGQGEGAWSTSVKYETTELCHSKEQAAVINSNP